jgi:hypothetical protein
MFTIARSAYLILIKFPRQSVPRFPRVLGTSCALPTVVRGNEARRIAANVLSTHMADIDIALRGHRRRRYRFRVGRKAVPRFRVVGKAQALPQEVRVSARLEVIGEIDVPSPP